ncbi:MAG: 5,6-dimethylbenzimidazole synthase [Cycloclasticus sp.]
MTQHSFSEEEKAAVYKAMSLRRDMRHFNSAPLEPQLLNNILYAAHLAPSVGLMQPWRFIRVHDKNIRQQLHGIVKDECEKTAAALDHRRDEFLKLKVEGILSCSEVVIAALQDKREQHIFGRRTMPEMDLASLSCAIQNMWLAARAEGVGMGWVSLFEPQQLIDLFKMPEDSQPVAILCIGHVDEFYEKPMLVMEQWAESTPIEEKIFDDYWGE